MSASPPPSASSASANGSRAYSPSSSGAPLSANDRRERNKAASAKYRAKKHYQSGEMRSQITVLQDDNNVLSRQLDECRAENASLKNLVEKLKGRLVAEKVLKRLREVGREKKRRGSSHGAGNHSSTKVSAHDLAVSDDSESDDVVDAMEDEVIHGDDDDDMDEFDDEEEEQEKRRAIRKPQARRRVRRTEVDDEDYRED
ncbi:hypothetical protein BGZ58_009975 [Dissophora ornata]|nr:hypothetical protein BGZ58_009975 [Dissophora ornata]